MGIATIPGMVRIVFIPTHFSAWLDGFALGYLLHRLRYAVHQDPVTRRDVGTVVSADGRLIVQFAYTVGSQTLSHATYDNP